MFPLTGHEKALMEQDQVGDLDFPWFREYGTAFHTKGCLGVSIRILIKVTPEQSL